jgi:YgiT-type zinc finger domain-containing protein
MTSLPTAASTPKQCPNCESFAVRVEDREDRFLYGVGADAVELVAHVPLHLCSDCGLEYTDEEGEQRRHDAVCKHLGL